MERSTIFLGILFTGFVVGMNGYDIVNMGLHTICLAKVEYSGAWRAVDGDTNAIYDGESCSHTLPVKDPWWRTDLGETFVVKAVTIYNRVDCCGERLHNFTVKFSSSVSENHETLTNPSLCTYYFPGTARNGQIFNFDCGALVYARFVEIQVHAVEGQLTLCEVQVWGMKVPPKSCPSYTRISGRKSSAMTLKVTVEDEKHKCFFVCTRAINCNSLNIFSNATSYTCELLEDISEIHQTDINNDGNWSYYRQLL